MRTFPLVGEAGGAPRDVSPHVLCVRGFSPLVLDEVLVLTEALSVLRTFYHVFLPLQSSDTEGSSCRG